MAGTGAGHDGLEFETLPFRRCWARALPLVLAVALSLGWLAGCGKKNEPDPPGGPEKAIGVKPYPRS